MKTIAMPRAFRSRMIAKSVAVSCASRLAVGSSRTKTLVSSSSACAMATSCCTATEKEPTGCSVSMFSFRRLSFSRARFRALPQEMTPRASREGPRVRFLVTYIAGIRLTS